MDSKRNLQNEIGDHQYIITLNATERIVYFIILTDNTIASLKNVFYYIRDFYIVPQPDIPLYTTPTSNTAMFSGRFHNSQGWTNVFADRDAMPNWPHSFLNAIMNTKTQQMVFTPGRTFLNVPARMLWSQSRIKKSNMILHIHWRIVNPGNAGCSTGLANYTFLLSI